ncbi:sulfatase-like hydrolase/transferase [Stieleria sp. ICT_E10.1]|uniref:sulfatase-like hydrolase/transferase n=1 Tax=Stieleria sedimenti TaxID=2976331 RepID=UPI00217FEF6D|nr:sulfatase-like hydrolase/transferase [Stieleria sedimenti]MCS7469740.1 sulfatase-like hydrolase/transferase [Stieleria sedimenti]
MKHFFLSLALTAISGLWLGPGVSSLIADAPRPNILYFYVDDMGWGSIGPNGQADRRAKNLPSVRTPNLDQLAARGLNFTRGYGCHVCSPARSSQQSGFHQGHTFADRNDPNNAKKAMRADDILMGDALSAAGYVTGYWGKWGYGGSKDQANPVIDNVQTLPTSHGYRHVLAELHHVRAHTFFQPTLWSAPASPGAVGGIELIPNSMARYQGRANYPNTLALQDHPDYPKTAYCDDCYAFAALDFVRDQGQHYNRSGRPFFGLLAVQIPHAPFGEIERLPEWDQAYADDPHYAKLADQTRQWAAMVTRIDAHFGNILAALEDPNNDGDKSDSIADNTLVVFQSDNGGPGGKNLVELDANGGLRGTKGSIQEGGIRVPLLMRWPAMIHDQSTLKAGTDVDHVVDVTDLLPTFCELAGVEAPLSIDGVSLAPTLTGSGQQRTRDFIIHEAGNGQSIIRGTQKLVRTKRGLELYDLQSDHAEANDIAAAHPERVKELETLLLGERVDEPRGFANTYHHWTGKDGASTSDAANWSDYRYANAGITYMTDDGAPQLSWTARIDNKGDHPNTAHADRDVEFLGLEIRGGASKNAAQLLTLGPNVNLTGRNEIRIGPNGTVSLNEGTISTLRWIEVQAEGALEGTGSIEGTVYNDGTVSVAGTDRPRLNIVGDYHQPDQGTLSLADVGQTQPAVQITGTASLGGELVVATGGGFKPIPGHSCVIITADRIDGTFSNPENEVVCADGTRLTIEYSDHRVSLRSH